MASFDSYKCIKNITLKSNFYNSKILVSTQILIEYPIWNAERRALSENVFWNQKNMIS